MKLVGLGYPVSWDKVTLKILSSAESATVATAKQLESELDQLDDDILSIHNLKKSVSEGKIEI